MKLKLIMNDSSKYPECKTLLVDMEDLNLNLKNKFVVNNKILDLKSEFHITLVGNDDALLLKNKFIEISNKDDLDSEYSNLYDEIQELVNNSKISFVDEFHILEKKYSEEEIRISVVQIIKTDIIEKFRRFLKDKYRIDLSESYPTPHITLYKELVNRGIGLYAKEDLEKYSIKKMSSLE